MEEKEEHATFVMIGENQASTAMAKTVGLPMGIATKRILNGEIKSTGVLAPTIPAIYNPILDELTTEHDCTFIESKVK